MGGKAKYLQLASEALIPLLGFFVWHWSLYFILLFYFIDMLSDEFFMHLKSSKIVNYNGRAEKNKEWMSRGGASFLLLLLVGTLIHFCLLQISPGIVFIQELSDFWTYKEMGVQQGFLLVPLVVFVGYQQYKMEFLYRAKYRELELSSLWNKHKRALLIMVGFAALVLGLNQLFVLPEIYYVLGIVSLSTIYHLKY